MTVVKICGVTTPEDALAAAQLGADMLGLNFYPPSPRYVDTARAREIAQAVRAEYPTILVGVFVNTDRRTIDRIMDEAGLDLAQLSGDEPPSQTAAVAGRAVKAIRPRSLAEATALAEAFLPHAPSDGRFPALLVDAYHPALYGGTGEMASTTVANALRDLTARLMLAGGLTPDNVRQRVEAVRPWGVDVASGVEYPDDKTRKDPDRMAAFIRAAR